MAKVKLTDENRQEIEAFMEYVTGMFTKTTDMMIDADHQTNFEFRKTIAQAGRQVSFHCAAYIDPGDPGDGVAAPEPKAKPDQGAADSGDESEADRKKALIDEIKAIDPAAKASARMNVSTLEKMLEEARQANAEDEDPFGLGGGAAEPAVTLDDVRDKLQDLMEARGKDEVRLLLEGVGAKRLSDVPDDKYAELIKAANKRLDD